MQSHSTRTAFIARTRDNLATAQKARSPHRDVCAANPPTRTRTWLGRLTHHKTLPAKPSSPATVKGGPGAGDYVQPAAPSSAEPSRSWRFDCGLNSVSLTTAAVVLLHDLGRYCSTSYIDLWGLWMMMTSGWHDWSENLTALTNHTIYL